MADGQAAERMEMLVAHRKCTAKGGKWVGSFLDGHCEIPPPVSGDTSAAVEETGEPVTVDEIEPTPEPEKEPEKPVSILSFLDDIFPIEGFGGDIPDGEITPDTTPGEIGGVPTNRLVILALIGVAIYAAFSVVKL